MLQEIQRLRIDFQKKIDNLTSEFNRQLSTLQSSLEESIGTVASDLSTLSGTVSGLSESITDLKTDGAIITADYIYFKIQAPGELTAGDQRMYFNEGTPKYQHYVAEETNDWVDYV